MGDLRPEAIISGTCIAVSRQMLEIRRYASLMAGCKDPLFIAGEQGTGKTLLARAIHRAGRRAGPFIMLKAGLSPFWTSDGTYDRPAIEKADGGTLCVPDPGELDEAVQGLFLRYLETGSYGPLRRDAEKKPDVRIIFESRLTLDQLFKSGRLRQDLYYHLKAHGMVIPPLRDRPEDILPLARHFVLEAAGQNGKTGMELPADAGLFLLHKEYPGNVEELKARIYNAVQKTPGPTLSARILR